MKILKTKKGFTLVELLAVIVILAVILTIAVPNVMKIVEKQKGKSFESTAAMMISAAKNQAASNNTYLPPEGECSVIMFSILDLDNADKDVDGSAYDQTNSYVAIANNGGNYKYYVTLKGSKRIVNLAAEGSITSSIGTTVTGPTAVKRSDVGIGTDATICNKYPTP
ncbi:MAG: type II secretion system protein [Bacilli bacterium]|nr:type II secretion system protein [Bacilli bacterium]